MYIQTCNGENDPTKGNPGLFLVPCEVIDDILGINGFNDCWIKLDEVVDPNATNSCEPNTDYWSKTVANFVSSKSLYHEEAYQDGYRYPNNPICLHKGKWYLS